MRSTEGGRGHGSRREALGMEKEEETYKFILTKYHVVEELEN